MNYHHLLYFYTVAREGSVTAAARRLGLSQPTLSGQINLLEEQLKQPLFERRGRGLALTDAGRVAYRYAEQIFSLGQELTAAMQTPEAPAPRLRVGIADVLPKLLVFHLLHPLLTPPHSTHLLCREEPTERLIRELAAHELDILLTDTPLPPGSNLRAFSHLLIESPISFFAAPALAAALQPDFPRSLHRRPLLLPMESSAFRQPLLNWLAHQDIHPLIPAEFEDSALLKAFGRAGIGAFTAPSCLEADICRQYEVTCIGRAPALTERVYLISHERRLRGLSAWLARNSSDMLLRLNGGPVNKEPPSGK